MAGDDLWRVVDRRDIDGVGGRRRVERAMAVASLSTGVDIESTGVGIGEPGTGG